MKKRASSETVAEASPDALRDSMLHAWKTNARVTAFLVEHLSAELLAAKVPGSPRKTIRMLAAHLHNCRCGWTKTLGKEFGIAVPASVDRFKVTSEELVAALGRSSDGILSLLRLGCEHGGTLPAAKAYVWRNLPLDVGHVLSYFVAHEAHHRGQIVMMARVLGYPLPASVNNGLWDFTKWARTEPKK